MKNSIPKKFKKSIEYESKIKKINFLDGHISYKSFNLANNEDVAILIHGTGAHKHWWDPLAPQISDIGTIIVPDLPGMGDSSHFKKYDFDLFMQSLLAVMGEEKIENKNIYLIGHSLGGHLAAYLASERPELIKGIIIIDSPIRPPDYDYSKHINSGPLRPIKLYDSRKEILSRFRLMPPQETNNQWYLDYIAKYSIIMSKDGWRWKFDDRMFTSMTSLDDYGFKFSCPALFIAGGKSLLLNDEIMNYMQDKFSSIMQFATINNAAHHVLIDEPDILLDLINKKLSDWT